MAKPIASQILSVIEKNGWWKGKDSADQKNDSRQYDSRQCVVTARHELSGVGSRAPDDNTWQLIADVIMEYYPDGPWAPSEGDNFGPVHLITQWNDAPQTKLTHVRKVLREVARREASA